MKGKKWIIFAVILIVCLTLSVVNGLKTKASYIDNVELKNYLSNKDVKVRVLDYLSDSDTQEDLPEANKVKKVQEVEQLSDDIVKVKIKNNSNRKMYYESILSQVEILKVYKGDLKENQIIYVFEHIGESSSKFSKNILYSMDGYNMMQESEEYLLLLKRLKNTYFGEEGSEFVYVPSTSTFSKYRCDNANIPLFESIELGLNADNFSKDKLALYSDVKDEEIFLCDEDQYNQYINFKKILTERYN
ncbi:hypothetical protein [Anaerovorax odorimutans]|uniref:hypothetical protein n=1 Tax=Anaerovorax odorimutans TaxID=109327 RepID=UPI00041AFB3F|nr:hypothetical protein [Anaerovorax odorimutans]